jgi:hypothetical protein
MLTEFGSLAAAAELPDAPVPDELPDVVASRFVVTPGMMPAPMVGLIGPSSKR